MFLSLFGKFSRSRTDFLAAVLTVDSANVEVLVGTIAAEVVVADAIVDPGEREV